jgi:hypothetical protein
MFFDLKPLFSPVKWPESFLDDLAMGGDFEACRSGKRCGKIKNPDPLFDTPYPYGYNTPAKGP